LIPNPDISLAALSFAWTNSKVSLFENLSFTIPGGDTTCLIGPNGSGKTTLLELILGWRTPKTGVIRIDGRDVRSISSAERGRLIALVPQEERLPFAYTVLEYVLLGRAPHLKSLVSPKERDREIAMNALKHVGIASFYNRNLTHLSGGEMRLVLIARALVQQPRILLLDEPTNHLDPANQEMMVQLLKDLKKSDVTLILSSHEPDIVTRLADHVVLLKKGKQPELGLCEDMMVAPKLSDIYGIPVRIIEVENRRVIVWDT